MSELDDKIILNNLETLKHINVVRANLYKMILELDERARLHDQSKLESPEAEIFAEHVNELAKVEYGSEEYKELLTKVQPAIDHHYANNRHHPEFHKNGAHDMDLVDLLEMLMDWEAATRRNKNGNIRKSIEHNTERFKLDEVKLSEVFENTINRYF